jgi:hypothetical protein
VKKRKRKGISPLLGRGEVFWPTRARARALAAQLRPTGEGDGASARGRRRRCGPIRQREQRGGETALRSNGAANRPSGGERPAAGGLDDGLPPVARFLVHGEVA